MGYVQDELLENDQQVKGLIIGLEADNRLKRALSICNNIDFYRYQIDFKLIKD
jgi:restriction system protein